MSSSPTIRIYPDKQTVAETLAAELCRWINESSNEVFTIALSGGSTPKILFSCLAEKFADKVDWSRVHLFWGDERCVAPDDEQSNYGEASKLWFVPAAFPEANIHRVLGENEPEGEAIRYAQEIDQIVRKDDGGKPTFDVMMLGMGDDGHTASIFPHQMDLLRAEETCAVATHPESGQKRVTITGETINQSDRIVFMITGENKRSVLDQIINKKGDWEKYPTAYIVPTNAESEMIYFLDTAASPLD